MKLKKVKWICLIVLSLLFTIFVKARRFVDPVSCIQQGYYIKIRDLTDEIESTPFSWDPFEWGLSAKITVKSGCEQEFLTRLEPVSTELTGWDAEPMIDLYLYSVATDRTEAKFSDEIKGKAFRMFSGIHGGAVFVTEQDGRMVVYFL